jgi:hypothetical protein
MILAMVKETTRRIEAERLRADEKLAAAEK